MKRGECFGSLETGGLSVLRLDDTSRRDWPEKRAIELGMSFGIRPTDPFIRLPIHIHRPDT